MLHRKVPRDSLIRYVGNILHGQRDSTVKKSCEIKVSHSTVYAAI